MNHENNIIKILEYLKISSNNDIFKKIQELNSHQLKLFEVSQIFNLNLNETFINDLKLIKNQFDINFELLKKYENESNEFLLKNNLLNINSSKSFKDYFEIFFDIINKYKNINYKIFSYSNKIGYNGENIDEAIEFINNFIISSNNEIKNLTESISEIKNVHENLLEKNDNFKKKYIDKVNNLTSKNIELLKQNEKLIEIKNELIRFKSGEFFDEEFLKKELNSEDQLKIFQ